MLLNIISGIVYLESCILDPVQSIHNLPRKLKHLKHFGNASGQEFMQCQGLFFFFGLFLFAFTSPAVSAAMDFSAFCAPITFTHC
jgi:hypothetical protein